MKLVERVGIVVVTIIICVVAFTLYNIGKGKSSNKIVYWSYYSAVVDSQNEYWQPEIVDKTDEGVTIIRNNVTGQYFVLVTGVQGITLTPIETIEEIRLEMTGEGEEDVDTMHAGEIEEY